MHSLFWSSFSALDRYFAGSPGAYLNILTRGSLIEAARRWDNLSYPGLEGVDGLAEEPERTLLVRCDAPAGLGEAPAPREAFPVLELLYEPESNRFVDTRGIYPLLRDPETPWLTDALEEAASWEPFLEAAALVSRYPYRWTPGQIPEGSSGWPVLAPLAQRIGLERILEGSRPWEGLRLLYHGGFVREHWPELAAMNPVDQSKEHHPEGNVWEHTLETFLHRKGRDLRISLALLLHDVGKPLAEEEEGRRFNRHAQIGRTAAYRFLDRLGFDGEIKEAVGFLVGHHMIPGLSRSLPTGRVREVLSSPLYPLLLEVYRCDLCSTYRGPEGYYQACKVYRSFLKNSRNPFRGEDGKKILRMYVEK